MPKQVIEYRCLLISPGDVTPERDAITELGNKWNAQIGEGLGARIEFVRWETHSTPDMSGTPQAVINRQIVDDCDMGIAIFWGRLGTATDKHPSGSVEEIERLLAKQARVLVYICERALPTKTLDIDQYSQLKAIRGKFEKRGLLATYLELWELKEKVNLHLTNIVSQMLSRDRNIPATGLLTAPTPDVRVRVSAGWSTTENPYISEKARHRPFLEIKIENHAPIAVFIGSILFLMKDNSFSFLMGDYLTDKYLTANQLEIQPGKSFSLSMAPQEVRRLSDMGIEHLLVRDEIGREYRADDNELKNRIDFLLNDYMVKWEAIAE